MICIASLSLLTISHVNTEDAQASIRHNCGCKNIVIEVWDDPPDENTTWGAIKQAKPRKKYTKKCDIRWHINPFYHKGACD